MERQMDLIRAILEWLARQPDPWSEPPSTIKSHDFSAAVVAYHVDLCQQAGFIERCTKDRYVRLTWAGHNKLAELRVEADQSVGFMKER